MNLTIGHTTFDRVRYDVDSDVLYLHVGDPANAVDFDETPEGHALRLDGKGRIVGLTIVRPKHLLERYGEVRVTLPVEESVAEAELRGVLAA